MSQVKHEIIYEKVWLNQNFLEHNNRLKLIIGSDKYFDGLNIITIGNFCQLAPFHKSRIFQ